MDMKKSLYTIFEEPTKHKFGSTVQFMIFSNIIISIVVMFLETEKGFAAYFPIFAIVNKINVALFTFEYVLRLYSITYQNNKRRIKYALSPYMIIDLVAILPFYLSLFNLDFGFLRALRIIRIFKLFRLSKFAHFDTLISEILKEKKEEFIFIFVALMVLVLTITPLVYFAERNAQPEVFSSMGTTMWWAIITFTTVGYGDMFPVTTIGRILTSFVSFLGIAFYAIPGSIFTSALLDKINEKKRIKNKGKKP